jgi:hypothetical protein
VSAVEEFDEDDLDEFERVDIGGEAEAEWALHRIARLKSKASDLAEQHALMVARYDDWLARTLTPIHDRLADETDRLGRWMDARLAADPKAAKTVHLPAGTVTVRKGTAAVVVDDEAAALTWAEMNAPHLIRKSEPRPPVPTIDKSAVKRLAGQIHEPGEFTAVTADGEIIPGVHIVVPERSVTVHIGTYEENL